jgi:endonuclease G
MNFNKIVLLAFILLGFISCKQVEVDATDLESPIVSLETFFNYLPTSTTNDIVKHKGYVLSYVEKHEQAEWVAYFLENKDFSKMNYDRPFFNQDPMVKTESADWRNYKKSGYNKGHLCPAGDRKESYSLYEETFYTSNASPQLYGFNAGVWNRLEQKTRYWATKYDGVYVVTGGVLTDGLKTIGKENVSVPNYFYKILLTTDGEKMIGFLLPHENSNKALYEFVVSVDSIEKMTGIDFFPNLEDDVEEKLESNTSYKNWLF